jgi:hypothetical protein
MVSKYIIFILCIILLLSAALILISSINLSTNKLISGGDNRLIIYETLIDIKSSTFLDKLKKYYPNFNAFSKNLKELMDYIDMHFSQKLIPASNKKIFRVGKIPTGFTIKNQKLIPEAQSRIIHEYNPNEAIYFLNDVGPQIDLIEELKTKYLQLTNEKNIGAIICNTISTRTNGKKNMLLNLTSIDNPHLLDTELLFLIQRCIIIPIILLYSYNTDIQEKIISILRENVNDVDIITKMSDIFITNMLTIYPTTSIIRKMLESLYPSNIINLSLSKGDPAYSRLTRYAISYDPNLAEVLKTFDWKTGFRHSVTKHDRIYVQMVLELLNIIEQVYNTKNRYDQINLIGTFANDISINGNIDIEDLFHSETIIRHQFLDNIFEPNTENCSTMIYFHDNDEDTLIENNFTNFTDITIDNAITRYLRKKQSDGVKISDSQYTPESEL